MDGHASFEHVKDLVLAVVDVERGHVAEAGQDFDDREPAVGVGAFDVDARDRVDESAGTARARTTSCG